MKEQVLDGITVSQGFGVISHEVIASMSGLEFLQGIIEGKFPAPLMAQALQFRLLEVGEGTCTFTGIAKGNYLNPMGTTHGGYSATLLDSALGCCVHTLCPVGYACTSIELKVNFVRPILPETGRLFARAHVVHSGRQIATSEGRLEDENGKLYSHGSQTCSIFKIKV